MDRDRHDEDESPIRGQRPSWAVYVERTSHQWVVRDPEGQFWILPGVDDPWGNRLPFRPTEDTGLDPVPAHYKHVLGLPF